MSKLDRINPPSNVYSNPPTGFNAENGDTWATVINKINAVIDHINGDSDGEEAPAPAAPIQYGAAIVRTGNEERDEDGAIIDGTDVTKNVEKDEDGNEMKTLTLSRANLGEVESSDDLERRQADWSTQGITHIAESDGAVPQPVGEYIEAERKKLEGEDDEKKPVQHGWPQEGQHTSSQGNPSETPAATSGIISQDPISQMSDADLERATRPERVGGGSEDRAGGKGANEPVPAPVGSGEATVNSQEDPTEGQTVEAEVKEPGTEQYPSPEDDEKVLNSQPNIAPTDNVEIKPPSADPYEETDGNPPAAQNVEQAKEVQEGIKKKTL